VLLVVALLVFAAPCRAGLVMLDFNSGSGEYHFDPYYEGGLRAWGPMIANGDGTYRKNHYDLDCGLYAPSPVICPQSPKPEAPAYDGSVWIGTDVTRCEQVEADGTFIGPITVGSGLPCDGKIRIDRFGVPFSAVDVVFMASTLTSSKGGVASGGWGQRVALAGDLWRDIEWLEITGKNGGAPGGIDNLVLQVDEPYLPALVALMIGCAAVLQRRSRRAPAPLHAS